ncbi:alanine racemase [Microbacterium sp. AG790]|uniref:alanine racemase n=1 Tax=Microbacterium sp. AG790 TaxID=2183995 RepID=UPI000F246163|nr:alanine racemase [Microbacterium sp. AG790]RKS93352.1 alanine racemase [Microbacterium sp. AG790]
MSSSPAWVEVDTAAVADNLAAVRVGLGPDTPICAVVKADAYGHGADLIVPVLAAHGVACIGVTSNDEARTARAAGFFGRILRLRAALRDEVEDAADLDIEEWVAGAAHAGVVAAAGAATGRRPRVHVSINATGISRDGIDLDLPDAAEQLTAIGGDRRLTVVGVASHFPCEDADDVRAGARAFDAQSRLAGALLSSGPLERHCATSYAALTVPASRFDLVRIGAALYGDTSASVPGLRPAMRLVSRIAAISTYPAGRTVGYDRTHRLDRTARLAAVPLGYADGYQRALGGRAEVLVRGRRMPVVDRLAMNTLLVDVSDAADAAIGDEVVLYGRQGAGHIDAADLERASGQIAANLYTSWGRLMPRRALPLPV